MDAATAVRVEKRDDITHNEGDVEQSLKNPIWEMRWTRQNKTGEISLIKNAWVQSKNDRKAELSDSQSIPFAGRHIFEIMYNDLAKKKK